MIEKNLQPGQKEQVHAEGTFIYVSSAPGEVLVEAHPSGYVYLLPPRGQVVLPGKETFSRISFTNNSEVAGTIKLQTGFGRYFPPNDGQVVTLSKDIELNIGDGLKTVFDGAQPVYFRAPPEVTLGANQQVTLTNPTLIPENQNVTLTGKPEVVVSAKAPLNVNVVNQNAQNPLSLGMGQTLVINGVDGIARNLSRDSIIIIAPNTNQGVVFIQGFIPLSPGGYTEIGGVGALSVTGTNGDVLHYGEMVR